MRSFTRAHLPRLALIIAGLLPLAVPPAAHAAEEGYRLLGRIQGEVGSAWVCSISYAFAGEALRFEDARNCGELAPIEALLDENVTMDTLARETAAAFRVWERVAGLSFHEVGDVRDADIVLGAQGRPRGRAFANVSYAPAPEGGVRAIENALVCLNPDHKWKVGFDGDEDVYDIRYTLIHEIGHAIGLDHPGPSGQVMAFRYTEAFKDLQPGDMRGVRLLYGHAADDGGPASGFDSQLARKSTEAYHADNPIGHSVISTTEAEQLGSIKDLIN